MTVVAPTSIQPIADSSPRLSGATAGAATAALLVFGMGMIPFTVRTIMYSEELDWFGIALIFMVPVTIVCALVGAIVGRLASATDKATLGVLIGVAVFVPIALLVVLVFAYFGSQGESLFPDLFHAAVVGGSSGAVATIFARRRRRIVQGIPDPKSRHVTLTRLMTGMAVVAIVLAEARFLFIDKRPTVAQVENQVRNDLPIGSSRTDVQTWIDQHRLTNSSFPGASQASVGKQTFVQQAGLTDDQVSESVHAVVRNANTESNWAGEIEIWFYFDGEGTLIGYAFRCWRNAL
jgi:hypothetical protein